MLAIGFCCLNKTKKKYSKSTKYIKVKNRRKTVWNSVNTSHLANMYIVQCSSISTKHFSTPIFILLFLYPYPAISIHIQCIPTTHADPTPYACSTTRQIVIIHWYRPINIELDVFLHCTNISPEKLYTLKLIDHESPRGLLVCRAQIFEISKGNLYIC